jgi:hypothetical protein
VSDAVRIFLALIYGIKAAAFTYIVTAAMETRNVWPGVVITFTSVCPVVMIATSPGRGR